MFARDCASMLASYRATAERCEGRPLIVAHASKIELIVAVRERSHLHECPGTTQY
jgi:hypothetical protein